MFIADLSEYQGNVNFSELKNQVELVILRDQAGYLHTDTKYSQFVSECKKYNIPFDTYAYFKGASVSDAIAEAKADIQKMKANSGSGVAVVDVEAMTTTIKTASELKAAVNAFVAELKQAGFLKVMLYSNEYFYREYGLSQCTHDALWLAKYNANNGALHLTERPSIPCDLWQYTNVGRLNGISGYVDLSALVGKKPLSWFTESGIAEVFVKPGVGTLKPAPAAPKELHVNIIIPGLKGEKLGTVHEYIMDKNWWYSVTEEKDKTVTLETGVFIVGSSSYNYFTDLLKTEHITFSTVTK